MSNASRSTVILLAALAAAALGVLAAMPIYDTWWLAIAAAAGLIMGGGIALLGSRRLALTTTVLLLFLAFVLTVVPVAVPSVLSVLPGGLLQGLLDGVSGVVLGWKQLLTLALPVGTYQAVMVPAYVIFLLSAFLAVTIAMRAGRFASFAALPLLLPVAFGTVFGASQTSWAVDLGILTIPAPRELSLWLAAAVLGAVWVWFAAGAERRAALRRGRVRGERRRGAGRGAKVLFGAGALVVSLAVALALIPAFDSGARQVPRDQIDPEVVLRERASPLTAYRVWKRDTMLDTELFSVSAGGQLPERLRLAVLDTFDGVDFHVGSGAASRFSRFPSGTSVVDGRAVSVTIGEGYSDIWVPAAKLGSVPAFTGPRATELADSLFVSRDSDAAIAVPGGSSSEGLQAGDGFTAEMETASPGELVGEPLSAGSLINLESMPELAAWVDRQQQPTTAEGLLELIDRLRARGYLSHSVGGGIGESLWLARLSDRYGTQFESSPGGHSAARLELLFSQLNAQQRLAGEQASSVELVGAAGDDEQFAAAAALIARALGFESRVVLGVRLGSSEDGVPGVPACTTACTGEHMAAWIEVRGAQETWVPIDVTPQLQHPPTRLVEGEQLPEFATTPEERDTREVDPPVGFGERSDPSNLGDEPQEEPAEAATLKFVGLSVLALLLLLIPLFFLPLAKRLRARSRRRENDPELRALGAWQELVDAAVDHGARIPPGASRSEIAEILDTAPARWAAATADRAVFSAQGVTGADAEWMWEAAAADRAQREAGLSFWQKLRGRYALGSYGVKMVGRRGTQATHAHPPITFEDSR